jgi:hypothetical protein
MQDRSALSIWAYLRQLTEFGILFLFSANFIRSVGMLRLSQDGFRSVFPSFHPTQCDRLYRC